MPIPGRYPYQYRFMANDSKLLKHSYRYPVGILVARWLESCQKVFNSQAKFQTKIAHFNIGRDIGFDNLKN